MDSLHYIVKYVKDTWRQNKVVSTLFLDIRVPSQCGPVVTDAQHEAVRGPA